LELNKQETSNNPGTKRPGVNWWSGETSSYHAHSAINQCEIWRTWKLSRHCGLCCGTMTMVERQLN